MAGWLKKKRMGGNVQNLWEDKTAYGKGFHTKLFNEDDEMEDEDEEEGKKVVKECGLDRISQITSPEFGGKMVSVDDDEDEYESEYEGEEDEDEDEEEGKEVTITVKSEEDEEGEESEEEEEGESEEGESEDKESEDEEESEEDDKEIEEAATGLNAQSKDPVEKLAAMISGFRSKSGESVNDKDALRQAAKTLLFGDLKKLNLSIEETEDEGEEDEESKEKEDLEESKNFKKEKKLKKSNK